MRREKRGRPVAQLVLRARPLSNHRWLHERINLKGKPLSETIAEEREGRL